MTKDVVLVEQLNMTLSDLEVAWIYLKNLAVQLPPSSLHQQLLSGIHEAMQWKSLYDINSMEASIFSLARFIRDYASDFNDEIVKGIGEIMTILDELKNRITQRVSV